MNSMRMVNMSDFLIRGTLEGMMRSAGARDAGDDLGTVEHEHFRGLGDGAIDEALEAQERSPALPEGDSAWTRWLRIAESFSGERGSRQRG